jgi:UDP-glucose 4-epimerase
VPAVTLRPFNTFGPRQSARAVIPSAISQFAAGATRVKLGALDPTRDFLFVKDTAAAFHTAGTAPAEQVVGELFNAATNTEISIGDLVTEIAGLMGIDADVIQDPQRIRPKNSEVMRLYGDGSKFSDRTGWKPEFTRQEGLSQTIEWFSDPANLARYRTDVYNQ